MGILVFAVGFCCRTESDRSHEGSFRGYGTVYVPEYKSLKFPGGRRFLLCKLLKNTKFINDPWFLQFFVKAEFYFVLFGPWLYLFSYFLVEDLFCNCYCSKFFLLDIVISKYPSSWLMLPRKLIVLYMSVENYFLFSSPFLGGLEMSNLF